MSMEEVVDLLGLSAPTVGRLIREGHVPAHRVPGGKKLLFRHDEVLDAVSRWTSSADPVDQPDGAQRPIEREPSDPIGVWCPAPTEGQDQEAWMAECTAAWCAAAERGGLRPARSHEDPSVVELDGLRYRLLVGLRQRVHTVDDDGDERWELLQTVWVEPVG